MRKITRFAPLLLLLIAACGNGGSDAGKPAAAPAPASAPAGFDQTLGLNGIKFRVTCPNDSSLNTMTILPSGLEVDNSAVTNEIDGTITKVEIADIDGDGSPEIYVSVNSVGSGSYGTVFGYAVNKRKSMSPILFPPLENQPEAMKGYMGHDEFRVVESGLVRRFPVYLDGDTNAKPTGGTRQISYKLKAGEAGWVLRPEKPVSY
jgi:hypothetical protein